MMEIFEKISENDIVHFEDINKDDLCFFLKAGRLQLETI